MTTWLEKALAHDWTGVFAPRPPEGAASWIVITCAHHGDNAFYELGFMDQEVTPERLFANLPAEPPHDCQDPKVEMCWILDRYTAEGLIDDREVTEEQATALLGRDVLEVLAVGRASTTADRKASHSAAVRLAINARSMRHGSHDEKRARPPLPVVLPGGLRAPPAAAS